MQTLKLVLIGVFGIMLMMCAAVTASTAAETKAAVSESAKKNERVVLQVSDGDPKTWNQALNVVKNLKEAYGKATKIEVVVFGNGIGMLKMDSEVGNRVSEALESGAKVYACQNTMRGRKLTKDDMLGSIGYVPAGIVEIITRQRQGWVVVRP